MMHFLDSIWEQQNTNMKRISLISLLGIAFAILGIIGNWFLYTSDPFNRHTEIPRFYLSIVVFITLVIGYKSKIVMICFFLVAQIILIVYYFI